MSYVGQVKKGSTTHLVGSTLYGTCATAAGTAAKVGTLANFDALITGVTIHLKFSYANTATDPTLNVNNTGAKPLVKYGTTRAGASATASWYAGSVVALTYDGTSWVINDFKENTNTTYSAGTNLALSGTTFSVKDSPAFTGTPTAPTNGTATTKNTQIATTAFVQNAINNRFQNATYVSQKNVSLPNNAETRFLSWTAPSDGVIIGIANAVFPLNATGVRHVATERNGVSIGAVQVQSASSGRTTLQQVFVSYISAGQELKVRLFQNSGSAMTVEVVGLTVQFIPRI